MTNERLQNKIPEGYIPARLCYKCLDVPEYDGAGVLGMKGCDKCGNYVNEPNTYIVLVPEEVYYEW